MVTRTIRGLVLVGITTLLMAGCASTQQEEEMDAPVAEAPAPTTTVAPAPAPAPEAIKPMVRNNRLVVPLGNNMTGTEALQGLFYFDFDQAIVKRAGHAELNKHAQYLSANRSERVRLEGHADERGTREYNLALGERRANAVKAYLQAQGVMASQMEVISYGEEKPASDAHNESGWALNRRVEIVYK
ncbi:MAG: peptidoglycan-associated lipoprotein Pal [Pseudomonadota bacterium]